jgi:hypothetical protein
MQTNQSVPNPFPLLILAIAYLLGGIVLFDASIALTAGVGALIGEIFSILSMAAGFFLVISSFFKKLTALVNRINFYLLLGLFIVAAADFLIVAVESTEYKVFHIVLAFVFWLIVLAALVFQLFRGE